ncbi:PP2C family serine/threonine-protein phosphatase [Agreia sp. COWG]|uniref:PP2C family protein-serine/threonine phosphatase n=1 Tax=Agreia sp. COWG TaxID=2773266 RepID=UPI0019294D92|nr:protein phosphatase 2C domain-containing protein [Agreia sp. COWG]CAD6000311.1 PPM-type phosphatase domain-containing protein [Agreia sp. COWG]
MTQIGDSNAHVSVALPGAADSTLTLTWSFLTDRGNKRAVNEDSVVANPPLFAVADGMGGHSAGDIASAAVVTRLGDISGRAYIDADTIDAALGSALADIDLVGDESNLGTGTTVTGVALTIVDDEAQWAVFNIGDSRVYFFIDGELEQITTDHSVVQEMVAAGLITREQADVHPDGNIITRAVGFHEKPVPDYALVPIEPGQRILVCSDGLTKELTDHGIRHYLATTATAERAASELVAASLANGGRDNVTVLVLDVTEASDEVDLTQPRGSAR